MRIVIFSTRMIRCGTIRSITGKKFQRPIRKFSQYKDPQAEASQRIEKNAGSLSGIEAVQAMPASVHRANYATAAALMGFVGYVFWYSMNAVGQNSEKNDPLATLQKEAAEARAIQAKKESNTADLAQLDVGFTKEQAERGVITLAVAAPDDIATKEEERNQSAANITDGKKKRSLINRIIFFWK
mmetsp:Transcript_33501/g.50533  ORF Transcript_33501/g.50533 Transcript_33501/m.50533 type:complete len:185 (-) Transcript_33501:141-695(-)